MEDVFKATGNSFTSSYASVSSTRPSGMWRPDVVMLLLAPGLLAHCRLTGPASCLTVMSILSRKKREREREMFGFHDKAAFL